MDKTLIIIPGWGGDKSTWQQAQTLFSKHIETICIELPCFGDVPCPKDVWGVKEYANFVEQSIQALNKKNIVILGHSFGGQVATYLVAKNNTIAKKLILSGAAVYRPKRSIRRGLFLVLAKCGTLVFRLPFISQFESIA
ncbi:MAG: alpha/beta fold hydrolase, partial [Candidatus Magasanikbacteria bacterium]|nr:alpha/beta fold hydrolase [Candidatus Magasanikbacteria bacterium]